MNIILWRTKNRKEELIRLSEEQKDFEYRRLFIEEYKEKILINKNRQFVSERISWAFLFLALFFFQTPQISFIIFGISLIFKTVSFIFKILHKRRIGEFNLGLVIVDSVINKDYGINLS
jgi:hypothetical protein